MYQKTLKYFLESNMYFLEIIGLLFDMLIDSNEQINIEIVRIANEKLHIQGGRYTLNLSNAEIKKFLSYKSEEKCAYVIFLKWLNLPNEYISEMASYRKKDAHAKCIQILRKWYVSI